VEIIESTVEDFANNMKNFLQDIPTKFVKSPVKSSVKSQVKSAIKRRILTDSSNGAIKISMVKNKTAKSTKKATKVVRKKFLPKKLQAL
jgi:hypothetical protein